MTEESRIESAGTTTGTAAGGGDGREWVRQESEHLREELQRKGESLFGEQKASLAAILNGIANAMERSAPNFEEEGQPNTARYTRQASENLHRFSEDLRERDLDSLKRQVTDLTRRQPGLVVGGAVALGFIASRFFRSSSEHQEEEYRERGSRTSGEELIAGTKTETQAEEASPIITEREFRESEKEFPT